MLNILGHIFWVIVIYAIVAAIWMAAEKLFYGQITTRHIDSVVALILAISIYINIKNN